MHDFVAEDMFNFVIKAGTGLYFYETINHQTTTLIKGAYYVNGGDSA